MSEHKQIQLYVGLDEGGCVDVGTIRLAGFTLVSNDHLAAITAQNKRLCNAVNALLCNPSDENWEELRAVYSFTPLGCLREAEARAIESVANDILLDIIKPKYGIDCYIEIEEYLAVCADKIRQEPPQS